MTGKLVHASTCSQDRELHLPLLKKKRLPEIRRLEARTQAVGVCMSLYKPVPRRCSLMKKKKKRKTSYFPVSAFSVLDDRPKMLYLNE